MRGCAMRAAVWLLLGIQSPACSAPAPTDLPLPGDEPAPCDIQYSYYRVSRVDFGLTFCETLDQAVLADLVRPVNRLGRSRFFATCEGEGPSSVSSALALHPWIMAVGDCEEPKVERRVALLRAREAETGLYEILEEMPTPAVGLPNKVSAGRGSVPLSLLFTPEPGPTDVSWVSTLEMTVEFTSDSDTISGLLGFALTPQAFNESGLPALTDMLNLSLALTAESDPERFCGLRFIDMDRDGSVTLEDFTPEILQVLVEPDLDLFEDIGNDTTIYNPWADGIEDHVSMGMRFEAEPVEVVP